MLQFVAKEDFYFSFFFFFRKRSFITISCKKKSVETSNAHHTPTSSTGRILKILQFFLCVLDIDEDTKVAAVLIDDSLVLLFKLI